jgi:hypothetical protein
MAASVKRLVPVTRNMGQAISGMTQIGMWRDNLVLVAATAQTYTLPTDSANNKASMLRVNALAGDIWVNFGATAAAPGANIITGAASVLLKTSAGPVSFAVPDSATSVSFLSTPGTSISIEAWL